MSIGMKKQTKLTFEQALEKVPEALKAEGFGILTRVDIKDTLKTKLNVDFRRYVVLGACNPLFAHKALSHDSDFGVLLPCSVVIYEGDDGKAVVTSVDPTQTVAAQGDVVMQGLVSEVRGKLASALEKL